MEKIKELLKNKKVLIATGCVILLVIILLIIFIPGNNEGSKNKDTPTNKIYNKDGSYIISKDYVATPEKCFEFENGTITKYYCNKSNIYNYETITDIVIPYKIDGQWVTTIEEDAFDYANISNLVMPNSIKEIKKNAFGGGLNSAKITFSETLETIGERAFKGNRDYDNEEKCVDVLEIPKSVRYIERNAFSGSCYKEVIISTPSIGDYAFQDSRIEKLTLKDGVKTIGKSAFDKNNIKHLEFPNTLEMILEGGFANNEIIDIKLNSGLNSIGFGAFTGYTEEKRYEIDFTDIPLTRIYLADKSQRSFEWDRITYNDTVEYILPGEKAKDFSICILETEKNEASIYEKIIIYKDGDNILDVKEYGISIFYNTGCNQLGWSCNFPAKEAAEEFEKKQTEAGYVVDRSYEEVSFEKKYEVKDLDDKSVTSYIKKLEAKGYNCQ